jgi:hypothetical protein
MVLEASKGHRSGVKPPAVTFECETLKADREAENHIQRFLPSLVARDAVGEFLTLRLAHVFEIYHERSWRFWYCLNCISPGLYVVSLWVASSILENFCHLLTLCFSINLQMC